LPLKKEFMRTLIFFYCCLCLLVACTPSSPSTDANQASDAPKEDRAAILAKIQAIETEFKQTTKSTIDYDKAKVLIDETLRFAQAFPQDSITPELIFRTAQVARAIKDYGRAIQLFGKVHRENPENPRSPTALFLQAFIFENHLNDKEQARKYYNHFLDKYPENELAVQVEQILKVIDKSPEELVKEFQKKNQ
ncbi:MAG: tetratricopeptide repeat protein, partial [Bacteroidota bacterium]